MLVGDVLSFHAVVQVGGNEDNTQEFCLIQSGIVENNTRRYDETRQATEPNDRRRCYDTHKWQPNTQADFIKCESCGRKVKFKQELKFNNVAYSKILSDNLAFAEVLAQAYEAHTGKDFGLDKIIEQVRKDQERPATYKQITQIEEVFESLRKQPQIDHNLDYDVLRQDFTRKGMTELINYLKTSDTSTINPIYEDLVKNYQHPPDEYNSETPMHVTTIGIRCD